MSEQDPAAQGTALQGRVFLERRSYRQRRIIDAARILPVVGLLLWLVPLVWPRGSGNSSVPASSATLYVFIIWIGLIIVGAFLAWKMTPNDDGAPDAGDQRERLELETTSRDRP